MVEKDGLESLSYFLDEKEENKLFIRYVFGSNFKEIEEFAVVYCIMEDDKVFEVLRYDCSKREAVNVHRFFHKKKKKRFLDKEKNFDTMMGFVRDIEKNWRLYRLKFLEK